ncbi:unnamed protein product, partial [Didymodactylos carnosus]
ISIAQSSVSPGEMLHIVNQLRDLFSNENPNREKLAKIIPNLGSAKYLVSTLLSDMITKYASHGGKIDQQTDFLELLARFKNIVEENIKKSTYDPDLIVAIYFYIAEIQQGYELLRNDGQRLEEIISVTMVTGLFS